MFVFSGGCVENTTIGAGGTVEIARGGSATRTEVASGGKMTLGQLGTIGGSVSLGGTLTLTLGVLVMPDTTIEFSLSERENIDSAMLVNMNVISDTTNKNNVAFSIVVDYEQKAGNYVLAGNASSFTHAIELYDEFDRSYGTLTVGKTISAYDRTFTLRLLNNELSLVIGGEAHKSNPLIFGNFTGGDQSEIAVTLPDGAVGVTGVGYIGEAASPWKIVFSGDFNGNDTDDLLLCNTESGEIAAWLLRDGQYQDAIRLA